MKIIFAGSGEFGLPTLEALLKADHQIVQVISQPDRRAGRGRHLTPTPIAALASRRGLTLLKTADINQENLPEADLMVVIAFGQRISQAHATHARLGSINLHGSRLPKFRGAAPIIAAILAGETVTGNSVIRVAEKMDAGAILGQSQLSIGELETAGELHERLSADGVGLMLQILDQIENNRITEVQQDDSQATRAPKLSRQSACINWADPAAMISRQIRAMYPWPGCHARLLDEAGKERARVTFVRARPTAAEASDGVILSDRTIGGVEIIEIQPEGKRPMPLAAFRNGHPWLPGMRVESI